MFLSHTLAEGEVLRSSQMRRYVSRNNINSRTTIAHRKSKLKNENMTDGYLEIGGMKNSSNVRLLRIILIQHA